MYMIGTVLFGKDITQETSPTTTATDTEPSPESIHIPPSTSEHPSEVILRTTSTDSYSTGTNISSSASKDRALSILRSRRTRSRSIGDIFNDVSLRTLSTDTDEQDQRIENESKIHKINSCVVDYICTVYSESS
jgi:hypothetical protein